MSEHQGIPPPRVGAEWRPAFTTPLLLSAAGGAVLLAVAYLALGRPWQALALVSFAAVMVLLWRLSRGRSPALITHLMLTVTLATEVGLALGDPQLDTAMVLWLGLLPAAASLVLNWRAGAVWLAIAFLVAGLLWTLRPPPAAETLGPVHAMRLAAYVLTFFFMTYLFGRFRQQALDAAQAASRAKSAFLAAMSHEIRTPMNGVLGMTEVMLQESPGPRQREQLAVIRQSGQVMIALLNDLLDLSRVEASKLVVAAEPFELPALLTEVAGLHAASATQRGLELGWRAVGELPPVVRGDALRLRQVLGNLLGNAVKFTEAGTVTLEVRRAEGGRVAFEVRDTGVGIAASDLEAIFEPFRQAEAASRRRPGGTGLGLALSRQLVRLMGGELTVRSAPGAGSTFAFELPLPEATLAPVPAPAQTPPGTGAAAAGPLRRVLVVDDNPVNLTVASALVRKSGFEVEVATGGAQALEAVQRQAFALVLMDCHMPGMDGFEATAAIRALPTPAARTPIVALTASAMPEELEACRRSGMDDCLTKPLAIAQLRTVLQRLEAAPAAAVQGGS